MSRFSMALTAAAASAIVAIAVVALPAIGDDSGPPRARARMADDLGAFVACLRTHGLADAPTAPEHFKPWLAGKEASDPRATKAAELACRDELPKPTVKRPGPDIADVISCVRSHGVDAPTDPVEFKQWLARQDASDPARLDDVLDQCKLSLDPGPKSGAGKPPADCGTPADKPVLPADAARRST